MVKKNCETVLMQEITGNKRFESSTYFNAMKIISIKVVLFAILVLNLPKLKFNKPKTQLFSMFAQKIIHSNLCGHEKIFIIPGSSGVNACFGSTGFKDRLPDQSKIKASRCRNCRCMEIPVNTARNQHFLAYAEKCQQTSQNQ